ncbi:hypothetical protein COEREDRAFT_80835, partial [Coemansia reversa NRRL 1564]
GSLGHFKQNISHQPTILNSNNSQAIKNSLHYSLFTMNTYATLIAIVAVAAATANAQVYWLGPYY